MNAKIAFCIYCAMLLFSCSTTNRTITDSTVIEYSRQLAILENGIEEYGESVADVRASIATVYEEIGRVREGAASISLTVEDTIILFDEYQRAVERLLQDYDRLRNQVAAAYANNSSTTDDTVN